MRDSQIEKLMGWLRRMRKDQWLLLLLAGILVTVLAMPVETGRSAAVEETPVQTQEAGAYSVTDLEMRLREILSHMEGAGRVRVMITLKSGAKKLVEKDTPKQERTEQQDAGDGVRSTVERDLEESTVYERDGSGGETPYVTQELAPQIEGVLVLAEGGGNAVTAKNITEAVMALFGVEAHKIKVMKMN